MKKLTLEDKVLAFCKGQFFLELEGDEGDVALQEYEHEEPKYLHRRAEAMAEEMMYFLKQNKLVRK